MASLGTTSHSEVQSAINTTNDCTNCDINEDMLRIMQDIMATKTTYGLSAPEFNALIEFTISRNDYTKNFTLVEDIYFESMARSLKGEEVNAWIAKKMVDRFNPGKSAIVGQQLATAVETVSSIGGELNFKPEHIFALVHKIFHPNRELHKHSVCKLIKNTMDEALTGSAASAGQGAAQAQLQQSVPPGAM